MLRATQIGFFSPFPSAIFKSDISVGTTIGAVEMLVYYILYLGSFTTYLKILIHSTPPYLYLLFLFW